VSVQQNSAVVDRVERELEYLRDPLAWPCVAYVDAALIPYHLLGSAQHKGTFLFVS